MQCDSIGVMPSQKKKNTKPEVPEDLQASAGILYGVTIGAVFWAVVILALMSR